MASLLTYGNISNVTESWDHLLRIEDYEEKAGILLFRKFFAYEPQALKVFGFEAGTTLDDDFFKNPKVVTHAVQYTRMLGKAVNLLGPDIDVVNGILHNLGQKHRTAYGVKASFYSPMGKALIETLEELIGPKHFTEAVKESWVECFQAMSYEMIQSEGSRRHSC
ncbi:unnamed protein product [Cylindrotheca closterium]|uniref:Globin domain-containing protein n=1 Tax=Cylindrotheca closterium TaxID=2856 RepID=A0AAD2FZA8_9STRA|nr:unnamed protein product [Cylindrotheca closterium]